MEDDEGLECPHCGHKASSHNDAGAYYFGQVVNDGYHMCYDIKDGPNREPGEPGPQFLENGKQNWCGCTWKPSKEPML